VGIHRDRTPDSPIIQVVPTGAPIEVVERNGDFVQVRTADGVTGWVDASYVMDEKPAHLVLAELESVNAARAAEIEAARATIEALRAELAAAKSPPPAAEPRRNVSEPAPGDAGTLMALQDEIDRALEENRLLREEASLREIAARQDAAAEIEALKAGLVELRRARASGASSAVPSPDLRELQRLAEENHRLKQRLEATHSHAPAAEASAAPAPGTPWSWSVRAATVWELAALGFLGMLAFFSGAFWIDAAARRRLGGFRL
jgi:uncharacterized protein YgiM (DUF1202 family)